MTNTEIIQALTGPFSAMVLAVIILFFVGRWLAANVPLYLDRHLKQIDRMVDSHNEDRLAYQGSLQTLSDQHNILARDVVEIKNDVQEIKQRNMRMLD